MLRKQGFTLSELLVTVVIMASLAAIAMPLYNKTLKRSRAGDALNVLSMIAAKQEAYFVSNGKYATSFDELAVPVEGLRGDKQVTVGNFEYTLSGLCVTASRPVDGYQINKNMQTQQEGCQNTDTTKACDMLKSLIPEQGASGCAYVPPSDGGGSLPPELDPCKINPASCCAGNYYNGTCHECGAGTIWSITEKKCICNATCQDGVSKLNPTTCKCDCVGECFGEGQVKDDYCNCVCPADKPEWDSVNQKCKNKCVEPKTRWNGTDCVCPLDKPIESDGDCISCDAPRIISGGKCVCPPDTPQLWDDGKCRICTKEQYPTYQAACEYTGSGATGPAGTFKPDTCTCECPTGAVSAGAGKGCKCAGGTPYFHSGRCNECTAGKQMTTNHATSNICCLPNQITLDGKTCRYEIVSRTISANILARVSEDSYGNCNVSGRTYYQNGSIGYTSSTVKNSSHCCKKGNVTGICYKTAKYRTGCESYPYTWNNGTYLSGVVDPCPPGSDQSICDANCSANGSTCSYKCVKSTYVPSTISKYKCYKYNNDCGETYTQHCNSAVAGTATLLTCVYKN